MATQLLPPVLKRKRFKGELEEDDVVSKIFPRIKWPTCQSCGSVASTRPPSGRYLRCDRPVSPGREGLEGGENRGKTQISEVSMKTSL